MTRHKTHGSAVVLALMIMLSACADSLTEAGESGTRWNPDETATETRSGVTLILSYDSSSQRFNGTATNTTNSPVSDVRVEIHLSNGTELGPTPRTSLNAQESKPVTLDARGQNFDWYSVHVEFGSSSG
ncbi:MAG: hypothetical protein F4106_11735 [Gemmatimonadetes bacterium]|nr:hypothetical protein [Gemmatimonadota bacterium]MXX70418.1 hypothetical protein [Gemmatimonadota bacterium]MYC93052.1 hypothetical protein [Gemmatimonadota bacterium]MYG35311.1 hypothetical protein [Gemmatimonadota bacterium]MYJ18685.1 hypothetical protein [Gemmatimonadota bacterium]